MPKYEDYQAMIAEQVWQRARMYPHLDHAELISAGHLAFCEAVQKWDKKKGRFSTYLFWRLRHQLNRVLTLKCRDSFLDTWKEEQQLSGEGDGFFAAEISQLSQEAQNIIRLIFNSGEELVDLTAEHIRTTPESIRSYLRSKKWKHNAITKAFTEIKDMLSN